MPAEPVIVSEIVAAPIASAWKAITDPDLMRQWYFEQIEDFRPEPGFETRFTVSIPGGDFVHLWRITEVDPGRRIACRWAYEGIPGEGLVTFELSPSGDQTRVQLTCHGLESFPQDIPEFTRESCLAGWNYFIRDRLKAFLEGR